LDHCDECGYRYDTLPREELSTNIRALGPRYTALLATPVEALRVHKIDGVWSPLEYACHMRDVLRAQRERVQLALAEDQPTFASMRREERVTEERYNEQSPELVAEELSGAAHVLADELDSLDSDGWQRTGIYNWPNTSPRTIDWIARHTIHEGVHHIMDIERLLADGEA
jgi:S-DNA-T family DNA segregation ATPase FtsK/SpoIIIE